MAQERDYVLGTHDEEIARLGVQHRVWRPRVLDAWRRAGFGPDQTLLDLGCGPGYASIDLAGVVGPRGRVIAIDRSRRFLDTLETSARRRGVGNIVPHELDLDESALPAVPVDGVWTRWVLAFVRRPRELIGRVADVLKPGGTWVLHEYVHYATWRLAPPNEPFEEFVRTVIESWRAKGGEPDVGLELPRWLGDLGFEIRSLTPIIDVIPPTHPMWQWPKSFIDVGLQRLVDLGRLSPERARVVTAAFEDAEMTPHTLMVTPAVLEIIATRQSERASRQ